MSYQATDDDLPRNLWPSEEEPLVAEYQREQEEELRQRAAVQLVYPRSLESQLERARRTARPHTAASLKEESDKKAYVRSPKRRQMYGWLQSLEAQGAFARMNDWEKRFATGLLAKFRKWGDGVKWITEKQYRATENVATKYLKISA